MREFGNILLLVAEVTLGVASALVFWLLCATAGMVLATWIASSPTDAPMSAELVRGISAGVAGGVLAAIFFVSGREIIREGYPLVAARWSAWRVARAYEQATERTYDDTK
ncbi:hypothetical protein CCP3SC15_1240002 [Gammaproteobacteria bacterium]